MERAVNYLRDVGKLWATSEPERQRAFAQEVFPRVVKGKAVVELMPKPAYAPLFLVDRR